MGKEDFGVIAGVSVIIGTLTGLGLSFTALPAFAAGAIIGAIPVILFCAYIVYNNCKNNEFSKNDVIYPLSICLAGAAIGAGLAAAMSSLFPGVMLGMVSAAGVGALIGTIALNAGLPLGLFAAGFIIAPIVDKVSEWIASPSAEPATPSKENEKAAPTFQ